MTRYKFSQDRKHTIWTRTHFTIDAPTQAEAIAKAATLVGQDVEDAEAEDERISIEESETLYDTMDEIPVEDNDGNSTIDIIFDNGPATVGLRSRGRMPGFHESLRGVVE